MSGEEEMGVCLFCEKELDVTPHIEINFVTGCIETAVPKYHPECEDEGELENESY